MNASTVHRLRFEAKTAMGGGLAESEMKYLTVEVPRPDVCDKTQSIMNYVLEWDKVYPCQDMKRRCDSLQ